MKLDVPRRDLGLVAIDELRAATLAQDAAAWTGDTGRITFIFDYLPRQAISGRVT